MVGVPCQEKAFLGASTTAFRLTLVKTASTAEDPSCLSRRPTSPIRPRDAHYYDHTIPFAERMFCRFGNVARRPGGLEGIGQIDGKKRVARIVCLPHPADFIVKIRKGAELPTARQSPRQEKQ